ncbi:transposase [bacterium]|nr:transposase [bacterium]
MPKPRKELVSVESTPYYHCTSRCVRRAFLCGKDDNGQDYEHRRQWVENRIEQLSIIFCIDVYAYAVMSNHHHVVLKIRDQQANELNTAAIIKRWHKLHKGTLLTQRFERGETLHKAEEQAVIDCAEVWRNRLYDISWFMKALNEPIARRANQEDKCTGHFWESRFKSQALLTEEALLTCMVYVDLNPIRAAMADTPEESDHTSIKKRIKATTTNTQPYNLAHCIGGHRQPMPEGVPIELEDYINLVDLTGRIQRDDKRGFINNLLPDILSRMKIDTSDWLRLSSDFERSYKPYAAAQTHHSSSG